MPALAVELMEKKAMRKLVVRVEKEFIKIELPG
jgi:hypothetical protein